MRTRRKVKFHLVFPVEEALKTSHLAISGTTLIKRNRDCNFQLRHLSKKLIFWVSDSKVSLVQKVKPLRGPVYILTHNSRHIVPLMEECH